MSLGAPAGANAILLDQAWSIQQLLHLALQVGFPVVATVGNPGIANHFLVRTSVVHQHAISISHSLHQRGVSATNLIRKHKEVSVLLELRVTFAVHPSSEYDTRITSRFQGAHVLLLPGIVPNDDQLSVGDCALERANKNVDIVFRNQPADKQNVIPLAQPEAV